MNFVDISLTSTGWVNDTSSVYVFYYFLPAKRPIRKLTRNILLVFLKTKSCSEPSQMTEIRNDNSKTYFNGYGNKQNEFI